MVDKANQALQWLETIRATLTDPDKRQAYDATLGVEHVAEGAVQSPAAPDVSNDILVCPECHTENPEGARFCGNCGKVLSEACPKCGIQVMFYEKFCPQCGGNIEELKYQGELAEAERRRREQEETRLIAEHRAREEAKRRQAEILERNLSILGGILGAIIAPIVWAALWPDVMNNTIGVIAQVIMGAIGGVVANQWLTNEWGELPQLIVYIVGFFVGLLGGTLAFPGIVLIIFRGIFGTH
jgi:hypothetical protein